MLLVSDVVSAVAVASALVTPPVPDLPPENVPPDVPPAVRSESPVAPIGSSTGGLEVESTAYCLTGTMANGELVWQGAVAANAWPLGTELYVSDSPWGPGTFVVADRIGHSSELDFAMPGDCDGALTWGRRDVEVAVVSQGP